MRVVAILQARVGICGSAQEPLIGDAGIAEHSEVAHGLGAVEQVSCIPVRLRDSVPIEVESPNSMRRRGGNSGGVAACVCSEPPLMGIKRAANPVDLGGGLRAIPDEGELVASGGGPSR